jgi:rubrerythrin
MKTSQQWWTEIKASPEQLLVWLRKQFHGEVTAAERIRRYCINQLPDNDRRARVLEVIAAQEEMHASWIGDLLRNRGEEPQVLVKSERYWDKTLGQIRSFEDAAGVAHHAETMRLERIRVIAADPDAPVDVRGTFQKILRDEEFHARAFQEMAGQDALDRTVQGHHAGTEAIGFISIAEVL